MSVYIYFKNQRWRIKCPKCLNANKLTMRLDKTLHCGKCNYVFETGDALGEMEKIKWSMNKNE
ncbi:MAG: hypothetical protein EHM47_00820 [Ignavibacteriales bacterium]|nr:MAG: hypothetical protein EHM47_00820 [Ignavibacteriales bacterium]